MTFSDAFQSLGYKLESPRTDWSAEADHGVCLSLWRSEIQWKPSLWMDTRQHCGVVELWNPAGNNKRKRHLAIAMAKFDGWIDVVIVTGEPGKGISNSAVKPEPWDVDARGKRWRLEDVDLVAGHFTVRALDPVDIA